jgi:hypothetical protein
VDVVLRFCFEQSYAHFGLRECALYGVEVDDEMRSSYAVSRQIGEVQKVSYEAEELIERFATPLFVSFLYVLVTEDSSAQSLYCLCCSCGFFCPSKHIAAFRFIVKQ